MICSICLYAGPPRVTPAITVINGQAVCSAHADHHLVQAGEHGQIIQSIRAAQT